MGVLLLYHFKVEPFESFSLKYNDVNFDLQTKTPNKNIVFVAIDEPSVNKFGRWPWNREILAEGIAFLDQADIVLLDMIFSEETQNKQDMALATSIDSLNASVCGFFLREKSTQILDDEVLEVLSDSSLDLLQSQIAEYTTPLFVSAEYAEINILPVLESCTLSGSFSTLSGSDHLLRSYPVAMYFENILYPSLAVQGLRIQLDTDLKRYDAKSVTLNNKRIFLDEKGFVRLNFYQQNQYNIISFLDIINKKVKPEYFKNKIVILGITEVGAGDVVSTPIGSIPGPLLHYTFLSNFLENHLIHEVNSITPLLIFLMILLPFILVLFVKKVLHRVVLNIILYSIVYISIRYLFVSHMLYIDAFYPLVALLVSMLGVEAIAFSIQEKDERFLKEAFSSYLSADLLEELIQNPKALSLGGEKKELSILFSDIRGFTSISEAMEPEKLIRLLNRYFSPMTEAVLNNGGMLDKYIGDAVMAFFNAPVSIEKHADAACKAALQMIEELSILNTELEKEGVDAIKIGIGINTAEVVVGNMGSNTRFNYTVIGDGVNLASRVEGLTKKYGITILITEFTVAKLKDDFIYRKIEPVQVKGKDEAVVLFELMPNTLRSKKIKQLYDEALSKYINGDLKNSEQLFSILLKEYDDNPSRYFLEQIKEKHPWGVHKMTTK